MRRLTRNNASPEGFRGKIKFIHRRACGYENIFNGRLRIIAQCG